MKMLSSGGVLMALGLVLASLASQSYGGNENSLRPGFYNGKCLRRSGFFGFLGHSRPVDVEQIVSSIVWSKYKSDKTIAPALIRMQFHDCFVNGCDASILLNGAGTEKTAPPNLSVRGYELIDQIKETLEGICPEVVSCADIIAMATRDVVYFARDPVSGYRYKYNVETGRRDGFQSVANNAFGLPPPSARVSDSLNIFAQKGLDANALVYLLGGGHSIGVTHCGVIQDRLSSSNNTNLDMNPLLARELRRKCNANPNEEINLDQGTKDKVDNSLYKQVLFYKKGIFIGDQELASHPQTRAAVKALALGSNRDFSVKFGQAMIKMQAVGVLTGTQGEIRRSCGSVNTIF